MKNSIKDKIIERIITKYSGKTFTSSEESFSYLRHQLDAELTGYFSLIEKFKLLIKDIKTDKEAIKAVNELKKRLN